MMHGFEPVDDQRLDQAEKYYGKYPGLVVDNKERDGQPHLGELLVEVSGILEETIDGSGEQALKAWARPCFVPGFFFVPEIGAQVWVEFAAGDINQPLWTGVWYPTDAAPQTPDGKAPTEGLKVIRTASGHVMQLDDSKGVITVRDSQGNEIILDDKGILLKDRHGNELILDDKGIVLKDLSGNSLALTSSGMTLASKAIKLGSDSAIQPLVLGQEWMTLFNTHMHIGNLGAPTSPPAGAGTPATPAHVSAKHTVE